MEYAIFYGHLDVVKFLVNAGADPRRLIRFKKAQVVHYPLTLAMTTKDVDVGVEIAKYLLDNGARATQVSVGIEGRALKCATQ